MEPTEIAWAAGFWDGEGCAYIQKGRPRKDGTIALRPGLAISQSGGDDVAPEVLLRFQRIVGCGAVTGPYVYKNPHARPAWRWALHARSEITDVVALLWPYLGTEKRDQAMDMLDRCEASRRWSIQTRDPITSRLIELTR